LVMVVVWAQEQRQKEKGAEPLANCGFLGAE
jgi:hypothetical protein